MPGETASPRLGLILAAGGSGTRFGRAEGKQLALLRSRAVLAWSAAAFAHLVELTAVALVVHPDRLDEYAAHVRPLLREGVALLVAAGGETRQESVAAGLAALPTSCDFIAVHDGARPLVGPELVSSAFAELAADETAEGLVVGHPAVDTLKHVKDGIVVATPDRTLFWAIQTPQIFRAAALRLAYERAAVDGFTGTDDSALVERLGGRVIAFEGPRDNIKVTHAEDLLIAEAILASREGE